jgi:hypothetical protein
MYVLMQAFKQSMEALVQQEVSIQGTGVTDNETEQALIFDPTVIRTTTLTSHLKYRQQWMPNTANSRHRVQCLTAEFLYLNPADVH